MAETVRFDKHSSSEIAPKFPLLQVLVINRKGPWEGYRRQAKRRLAYCLHPAFFCTHIFIERETSGYEAGV